MICPVCSCEKFRKVTDINDYFLSREPFELVECDGCGMVVTSNPPDEKNIGKYYESDDYISHNDNAKGLVSKAYMAVREYMLKRKRVRVKRFTKLERGSLLDIGSGTGHFLSVMKAEGWEVKGVEINARAREFSAAKFGLDVSSPDDIDKLPSASFDCITLWHVLEHFSDPETYMGEIRRLLKPDGACVIALPNCSSYDAAHYEKYWAAYDVPRHLWHFTPDTFSSFAKKCGFEVVTTGALPFDVFYISMLSEKYECHSLSFLRGGFNGLWFAIKTMFNIQRSSSLVYYLRRG